MNDKHSELVGYVMDNPYEAACEIEKLRAALQAYVDDAKSQTSQGKPGSPFAVRLAKAEAALAMRK